MFILAFRAYFMACFTRELFLAGTTLLTAVVECEDSSGALSLWRFEVDSWWGSTCNSLYSWIIWSTFDGLWVTAGSVRISVFCSTLLFDEASDSDRVSHGSGICGLTVSIWTGLYTSSSLIWCSIGVVRMLNESNLVFDKLTMVANLFWMTTFASGQKNTNKSLYCRIFLQWKIYLIFSKKQNENSLFLNKM